MTTNDKKIITITMSDRPPVTIVAEDWPRVASVSQVNERAYIRVCEHADGRRIVYGARSLAKRVHGKFSGFLVNAKIHDSSGDASVPDSVETVRAIRRVAGVLDMPGLADECIAELPAEVLS